MKTADLDAYPIPLFQNLTAPEGNAGLQPVYRVRIHKLRISESKFHGNSNPLRSHFGSGRLGSGRPSRCSARHPCIIIISIQLLLLL